MKKVKGRREEGVEMGPIFTQRKHLNSIRILREESKRIRDLTNEIPQTAERLEIKLSE